jgi:archaellum component FlaC
MGKITDQELKDINDIKQEISQIVYTLGELEYQKLSIDLVIDELKLNIKEIKTKEAKVLNGLKDKYGNVNINIETGEF